MMESKECWNVSDRVSFSYLEQAATWSGPSAAVSFWPQPQVRPARAKAAMRGGEGEVEGGAGGEMLGGDLGGAGAVEALEPHGAEVAALGVVFGGLRGLGGEAGHEVGLGLVVDGA